MKNIKTYIVALAVFVLGAASLSAGPVLAYNPLDGACSSGSTSEVCANQDEQVEPIIKTVINTLLYIIGILSVIMVIVAGIMYTLSTGNSGSVSKAKNMLIYAVVGLVIAFLAYAIVNWVLFTVSGGSPVQP